MATAYSAKLLGVKLVKQYGEIGFSLYITDLEKAADI